MTQRTIDFDAPRFDGPTLTDSDHARLGDQLRKVLEVISDGLPRTPEELESATGYRWASISARLRDLRKPRFGNHVVERTSLGNGQFSYRMVR